MRRSVVSLLSGVVLLSAPVLAETFTVNSTGDQPDELTGDSVCQTDGGVCTLRAAIEEANALTGPHDIQFGLAGAGPHTIAPATPLPTIHSPVVIDGYTQAGASPADGGSPAVLKVEIDGTSVPDDYGLSLATGAAGSTIQGLAIHSVANYAAIGVLSSDNNVIRGNHLGTNLAGTVGRPNRDGVEIVQSADNLIGGASPAARNVLSGNTYGVTLNGSGWNRVEGNYIGVNAAGTAILENRIGVNLASAQANVIGGDAPGEGNVISGNTDYGLAISGFSASGNVVQGNLIGLNAAGTASLGNGNGIYVFSYTPDTLIGGDTSVDPDYRNVISGNDAVGVWIEGNSSGTFIQGNLIGVSPGGTSALQNGGHGVLLDSAPNTVLEDNVISGNGASGVVLRGATTTSNKLWGNLIGLSSSGSAAIPNAEHGVVIQTAAHDNLVGGDFNVDAGVRNVISGNEGVGVAISGAGSINNKVLGNFIGTNAAGTAALGNGNNGVSVFQVDGGTQIGGVGTANVIASNGADGVLLHQTRGAVVQGNYVGIALNATQLGNTQSGVSVVNSWDCLVGGSSAGQGNVIVYNGGPGVGVSGSDPASPATGNSILRNSLYENTGLGIDLGTAGVTPNDRGDKDTGPNDLQNYPIIESAAPGSTLISGTLASKPARNYRLEFFEVTACDTSGNGEGGTFLGAFNVTTSDRGTASFAYTAANTITGSVTATATDLTTGDTSEFSPCQALSSTPSPEHDVGIAGGGFRMPSGLTNQAVSPVIKIKNFGDHAEDNVPINITTNATSATFCELDAADFSSDGDLDPGEVVQVTGCSIALPSIPGAYTYTLHVLHGSSTTAQGLDGNLANNTKDDGSTVK